MKLNRGTVDLLVGLSVRGVRVTRVTVDRLFGLSVRDVRVNRNTGDRLVGLSVRGVRVNSHFNVVLRLRSSGAVSALACRGRPLPYIPVKTAYQGMFVDL